MKKKPCFKHLVGKVVAGRESALRVDHAIATPSGETVRLTGTRISTRVSDEGVWSTRVSPGQMDVKAAAVPNLVEVDPEWFRTAETNLVQDAKVFLVGLERQRRANSRQELVGRVLERVSGKFRGWFLVTKAEIKSDGRIAMTGNTIWAGSWKQIEWTKDDCLVVEADEELKEVPGRDKTWFEGVWNALNSVLD